MSTGEILPILQESLFVILLLVGFLLYAMIRGRQSLINVIMGLYLALLISLKFPYYGVILGDDRGGKGEAVLMIFVFTVFTVFSTLLFGRLMPREWDETAFEGFGKKIAFAIAGTILVMAYSYHVLPITELIDPGTPMQFLFASEHWFFWWLLTPLLILFFL